MEEYDPLLLEIKRPILTDELRVQVSSEISKQFNFSFSPSDKQWDELENFLFRYEYIARYWIGFPNKGQVEKLLKIKINAEKLSAAINQNLDAGYRLVLESDLEGHDLNEFCEALNNLCNMEVLSPKLNAAERAAGEKDLRDASDTLQEELDRWWYEVVGTHPTEYEAEDTPFTHFLMRIARQLSGTPLGHSRTQVRERRRRYKKAHSKEKMTRERFSTAFGE